MGTQLPLPKGAQSPIFCPYLLWPNAERIKMPLGTEVGLGTGDFVLFYDGTTQTFKVPLGTEVNLGPGDVVLDGVPAPSP